MKTEVSSATKTKKISMLIFDGINPLNMATPLLVFSPNGFYKLPIELSFFAITPMRIKSSVGFEFNITNGLESIADADAIIIPGWCSLDTHIPSNFKTALLKANREGKHIVGLCLGAFILAEAGLLDYKRATTHWQQADTFRKRYPKTYLNQDIQYTRCRNIWTSAGGLAGIDTCLQLLQEIHGTTIANKVSKHLLNSTNNFNGLSPYVKNTRNFRDHIKRLQNLLDWMIQNIEKPMSIDDLACRVQMSPRTFTRKFKLLTNTTPMHWLKEQRINQAKILLESGSCTIETAANITGYSSTLAMRQHFKEALNLTPSQYRNRYKNIDAKYQTA